MSKDPRLRRQQSSRGNDGSSDSSTPPAPSTSTTTSITKTAPLPPTSTTTTSTALAPTMTSSSSTAKRPAPPPSGQAQKPSSRSRSQSRSSNNPYLPSTQPYNAHQAMQPRYHQQENVSDEQRAKEREYLHSNRPRDPYANPSNSPPMQGSQPSRQNAPPGQHPPRNNGYQDNIPTRQDSTGSSSSRQRSKSRGRSPGRQQQTSIPTTFRRPSSDFQPSGPYGRPDQSLGNQQSINKTNTRSWELQMPGPPKMRGSGMQGSPGGPTTPGRLTTPGTRYQNPFEKMAASVSGAPIPPPQASPTYPGPPPGSYTGGRAPNSVGYRGSGGRDTHTSSSLSSPIASDGDRSRALVPRNRSKSRSRPSAPQSYPSDRDRATPTELTEPPRERGRSKSVARRSKSQSRARSHSRARSRARSRPRSRSRYRSMSRPARQDISMGEFERTHRSPSRSKRSRYDYSDSSSEYSDSDSDDYRRRRRHRKKRRRYSSSEDDSSSYLDDSEGSDVSVAEVDVNGERTGSAGFTPTERINGPMAEMLAQLKRLNEIYSEREERQRQTQKKIRRLTKKLDSEVRGLQRDFRRSAEATEDLRSATAPPIPSVQPTQSAELRSSSRSTPRSTPQPTPPLAPSGQSPQQSEPVTADPSTRLSSFSRSRHNTWSGPMPDLTATGGQEPVRPPPSLIPSSAGAAVKTEEGQDESLGSAKRHRRVTSDGNIPGSSSAEVGVLGSQKATFAPGPTGPNYATAPSRSTGVKRVFDRATYDLPIANQRELSVLSLGNSTDAGRIGGGRGPRPLVLNPFARGTRFENIAAVNSLDGLITFYDINRQQKVMEIEPKESRVIPYAETLAWVSEDTLVAVSHLKHGADWAQSKKAMAAAKTEGNSFPSGEPDRFSLPETQTNLISIYYRDGILRNTVITIQGYPHEKPIQCVTAVAGEPNLMGYITAGNDKQLIHWRFTKRESGGFIGGGMANIHSIHSNTILSTMYSHTSGHLHSGGLDSRYIVYDIAHKNAVHNVKMGKIVHILQNPADPRVQAIVFSESKDSGTKKAYQYQLLDERVAGLKVLSLDHKGLSNVSKLSTPSWHTEGGLFCSGTDADGMINIWDVRWAGIRLDDASRPEAVGAVVADLSEAGIQAARAEAEAHGEGAAFDQQHPMLWSVNRRQRVISRSSLHRKGGPSQILNVGGNKIAQALFHPTRNVVMVQHFDGTLTFTDYNMITKSVV